MLFPESVLIVIEMTCTAKQQTITQMETTELIECEETALSERIDREEEKARELRKHLAQEKALRQLGNRKAHALAEVHRLSLIR
jgi:DNA gyrase/topoisomerase IV subunit A